MVTCPRRYPVAGCLSSLPQASGWTKSKATAESNTVVHVAVNSTFWQQKCLLPPSWETYESVDWIKSACFKGKLLATLQKNTHSQSLPPKSVSINSIYKFWVANFGEFATPLIIWKTCFNASWKKNKLTGTIFLSLEDKHLSSTFSPL